MIWIQKLNTSFGHFPSCENGYNNICKKRISWVPLIVSCLINKSLYGRLACERGDQWRCVAVVASPRSTQLQCWCFPLSLDQRMSLFLERNSISLWPMLIASRFFLGLVFVLELVCWNGCGDFLFEGVSDGGFEVFRG